MVSPSEITLHWVRQNKIAQKLTVLCQEYLEIREGETIWVSGLVENLERSVIHQMQMYQISQEQEALFFFL